jgi:hypothetical protein
LRSIEIERSTASRLSGWPAAMTTSSSSMVRSIRGDVIGRPDHPELVAAHIDLDLGEGPLHGAQKFIARAEEGDHRDGRGDDDGMRRDRVRRRAVGGGGLISSWVRQV